MYYRKQILCLLQMTKFFFNEYFLTKSNKLTSLVIMCIALLIRRKKQSSIYFERYALIQCKCVHSRDLLVRKEECFIIMIKVVIMIIIIIIMVMIMIIIIVIIMKIIIIIIIIIRLMTRIITLNLEAQSKTHKSIQTD